MKTNFPLLIIGLVFLATACGQKDELAQKKDDLAKMKQEAAILRTSIEDLEKEIGAMDPEFGLINRKSVLISTIQPVKGHFEHFVEVTGSVLSKKDVNISGEVSGRVQEVNVAEGIRVNKGQILARIDAESIQRNMEEVEKQLELATIIFEKQERHWKQQIGTEVQFLEAKNRKETLEKNLSSLKTQESKTLVRAPFNGTVEEVLVRTGELVQPGTPLFHFIGDSDLFVEADVSERYIGILNKGDSVNIHFPSVNENYKTTTKRNHQRHT